MIFDDDAPPPDPDTPLATLRASPGRRVVGTGVTGSLGLLLIWMAATQGSDAAWRIVLGAGGLAAIWASWRLWQSTAGVLVLTMRGLFDEDGHILAAMDGVRAVERGAFAFKPSNGFLLRLDRSRGRAWAPGLWWRVGRMVGVGGITTASEAKFMAEAIAMILARRDGV